MSEIRVRFFGTGNAFADGGRSHACIHLSAPGVSLLLDCGGSALPTLKRELDPGTIDGAAISHLHGDHFGGLPYLLMEQHYAGRRRPLAITGPAALQGRVAAASDALYPDFYRKTRLGYAVRYLPFGAEQDVGGAAVEALPVRHVPESDPHGLRVRAAGKVIAYSGDATWSDELVKLAKDADLFICEATNFSRDDPAHIAYTTLMKQRSRLHCQRIVLTHLGSETLAHLGELELDHAEDGTVITL